MNYTFLAVVSVTLLFLVTSNNNIFAAPQQEDYLYNFNYGNVGEDNTRHFTLIVEENQTIPISSIGPQEFDAWTFNGTVPGPTMRMTEGDNVSITVINSENNKLPHSMHMHSIHTGAMDGVSGKGGNIIPGESFTYNFIAQPYGVYPYHCHIEPIADHINRGLYGMMIIDPKEDREEMTEMVMLMNGYDMNYGQEGPVTIMEVEEGNATVLTKEEEEEERDNEIYSVNGKAFEYMDNNKIQLEVGEKYRIYLVNMLEFDLVNSFHVHGMMFDYYPSGTSKKPAFVNDIVVLGQGDRGIIEFTPQYPGQYMFHAHVNEFSSLGWMGFFEVKE